MLKSYLKVAVRNFLRNKVYSFLNIAGLGIGIAGCLLILVYVANQLSFESMHKHRNEIVSVAVTLGSGASHVTLAGAMPAVGPAAAEELPEVRAAVRFRTDANAVITAGHRDFRESRFFFADSNVFDVFTFPLVSGNKSTALASPTSIVISQSIARKYFGDADPIGKTLVYDKKHDFTVTAVMKDVSENTMLRPDIIAPYSRALEIEKVEHPWGSFGGDYTYLYLRRGASIQKLPGELEQLLIKNTSKAMASLLSFKVIPLSRVHFATGMMGELGPTVNLTSVNLFSMIAILVLVVACLNFVNLSTARSMKRAREVGLRKVVGAGRAGLIWQFFGESVLVTFVSLALALLIFELVAPALYGYFNARALAHSYLNVYSLGVLFAVVVFVAVAAGIYPAVFLSRYAPADTLRGTISPGSSGSVLKRVLVVAQFAIAIFLLICTAAIYEQIDFMRNSDLGFNKRGVIVLDLPDSPGPLAGKYQVIRQAFSSIPGVIDMTGGNTLPGYNSFQTQSVRVKGNPDNDYSMMQTMAVGPTYVRVLELKLVQGRNFSDKYATDSTDAVILNQSAVRHLGLKNAVGTEVYIPSQVQGKVRLMKVIGVIKNFHVTSFQKKIGPLLLYMGPQDFRFLALRIDNAQSAEILARLRTAWNKIFPGTGFKYSFLSQTYDNLYKSDDKIGSLVSIFAFLAILIGCMGLFGLVSHTVERRTKEIGIRKVMGAPVPVIVMLISKEFARWVLIANVIAWPLAYYAMQKWLQNFAYRANIDVWVFVASGALPLVIALITVGVQALRAARANPVEALRYE